MFHTLGTLQGKNRVEWLLARAPCWKRTDRQTQEEESKSEWPKKRISEGRSKSPGNSFKWVSYMVWFMLFFGFGFVFFNDVTSVNHWLLPYPKLHLPPREEEGVAQLREWAFLSRDQPWRPLGRPTPEGRRAEWPEDSTKEAREESECDRPQQVWGREPTTRARKAGTGDAASPGGSGGVAEPGAAVASSVWWAPQEPQQKSQV